MEMSRLQGTGGKHGDNYYNREDKETTKKF